MNSLNNENKKFSLGVTFLNSTETFLTQKYFFKNKNNTKVLKSFPLLSLYLKEGNQTGDGVDAVDKELHNVRLQHRQIAKLVLLDEDEEENEGDDADDHEEDARKKALVRLGTVHLIVVLLVVGHVVVGTVTGGDVPVD